MRRNANNKRVLVEEIWNQASEQLSHRHLKSARRAQAITDLTTRRKEANKLSAAQHREVLNKYLEILAKKYEALRWRTDQLMQEKSDLEDTNEELYGMVDALSVATPSCQHSATSLPPASPELLDPERDGVKVIPVSESDSLSSSPPSPSDDWPYGISESDVSISSSNDATLVTATTELDSVAYQEWIAAHE